MFTTKIELMVINLDLLCKFLQVGIRGQLIDSANSLSQTVDVNDCFETVGSSLNAICGEDGEWKGYG